MDQNELQGKFWVNNGIDAALAAIAKLGPDRGIPILLEFLPSLKLSNHWAETAVRFLLDLAFSPKKCCPVRRKHSIHRTYDEDYYFDRAQARPLKKFADLSPLQRHVLEVLLADESFWAGKDVPWLSQIAGLPTNRVLLRYVLNNPASVKRTSRVKYPKQAYDDWTLPTLPVPTALPAPPPASDHVQRLRRIDAMLRAADMVDRMREAIVAYLAGHIQIEEVWVRARGTGSRKGLTEHRNVQVSDGVVLDQLDLRLLDIYTLLGFARIYIKRIAYEPRVLQALDYIRLFQHPSPKHAEKLNQDEVEALANVEKYVVRGQPTALGHLILSDLPFWLPIVVKWRRGATGNRRDSRSALIELLLAHDPPYVTEALELAQ